MNHNETQELDVDGIKALLDLHREKTPEERQEEKRLFMEIGSVAWPKD